MNKIVHIIHQNCPRGECMGIKKLFNFKQPTISRQMEVSNKEYRYGGIIHQLQLDDFWHNLEGYEKMFIRNCAKWSFGGRVKGKDIDHPDSLAKTKRNVCRFLFGNAAWAYESKEYKLAEKLLAEVIHRSQNSCTLHRAYQKLMNIYDALDALDEVNEDLLQRCKRYCKEHINLAPVLFCESIKKEQVPPEIISFHMLKKILIDEDDIVGYESILSLEYQYHTGTFSNEENNLNKV